MSRDDRGLARNVELVGNHHEIRHFLYALRDMRVELAVETPGIRARILLDFGEKQAVESGAFRALSQLPASGTSVSSSFENGTA